MGKRGKKCEGKKAGNGEAVPGREEEEWREHGVKCEYKRRPLQP